MQMLKSANYSFQQLGSADTDRLKDLLKVFASAFEDFDSYQSAVPSDTYLSSLLAKPHFIALAAIVDGHVAGGLTAYVLDKFEQERREIYIYDLAVLETHRRQGIATGLINELRTIAAALDAYVIFVQADLIDAPAIALYGTLGIKETALHFDIAVRRRQS